jgi:hypothetical protein
VLDLAHDLPRIEVRIGVVPKASNLYAELTAFDNLLFSMQLYGMPRGCACPARAPKLLNDLEPHRVPQRALSARGGEPTDMWSRYAYIPFLVYGFLFEADARFGSVLRRHRKSGLALGLGLLLTAGLGGLAVLYRAGIDPLTDYGP